MTGTEVAVRDGTQQMTVLDHAQLKFIASTEFVPPGLRGNLPAILACVATGRALGIADMTSLRSIHIIDGKATFSAELMVMLARRAGHSITGKVSEGVAKVVGRRIDNGDEMEVEWTLAMAERAGLLGKSNWKKYPEAMLWARAVSQLCRELFADCFAGQTYTPEEIEDVEASAPEGDAAEGTPFSYGWEEPAASGDPRDLKPVTEPMKKKLNVLVGTLRESGAVTTAQVWERVGREQVVSEDGELHWSPLRDSLNRVEAHALIDWLESFEPSPAAPLAAGEGADDVAMIIARLLAAASDPVKAEVAIEKKRVEFVAAPDRFLAWLVGQEARLPKVPA